MFPLRKIVFVLIFLAYVFEHKSIAVELNGEKQCRFHDSCDGCLAADYNCAWCTDKKYTARSRCLTREELVRNDCAIEKIWGNKQEFEVTIEEELRDFESDTNRATQIKPQKIRIKLVKCKFHGNFKFDLDAIYDRMYESM